MNPYSIHTSRHFRKDYRRLQKAGKDVTKLNFVVNTLAQGLTLPPLFRNHVLRGKYAGVEECHIEPDWLLLYRREKKALRLLLMRTGAHRDVLGIE